MYKTILLFSLLATSNVHGRAQTVADLLLQLELDKEKLTSMKNTLQEMYQGYETLQAGYTHIRDIAKSNFNLHQAFLDALLAISPVVAGDPRIGAILDAEYRIVSGYRAANAKWSGSGVFTAQELEYIVGTYAALLHRCRQSVEELTMVLTADQLRMSDAERMQVIGRIDTETRAQLAAMQELDNTLSLQATRRLKEAGDINALRQLYGLPH
ncbi:MAG TPA: hypothetical protein VN616_07305 [Puia sp.]|nr:hypothetical protein [Puia sp.]